MTSLFYQIIKSESIYNCLKLELNFKHLSVLLIELVGNEKKKLKSHSKQLSIDNQFIYYRSELGAKDICEWMVKPVKSFGRNSIKKKLDPLPFSIELNPFKCVNKSNSFYASNSFLDNKNQHFKCYLLIHFGCSDGSKVIYFFWLYWVESYWIECALKTKLFVGILTPYCVYGLITQTIIYNFHWFYILVETKMFLRCVV